MLLFAAALVLTFQTASPLDVKVTYSNPGMTVPKLVEQLSQSVHVPLFAAKTFDRDVVAVRVKDIPLRDLLAKIGDVTAADWEKDGSQYQLTRSGEKLTAEEKEEFDDSVATFQKAIDKAKKQVAGFEDWDDKSARGVAQALVDAQKSQVVRNMGSYNVIDSNSWQKIQELSNRSPGGRAMARIVASMDAKELAGLPEGYKTVYSDQPTMMQRRLSGNAQAALSQMVQEQNVWADATLGVFPEQGQNMFFSSAANMRKPFGANQFGKVLFCVTKADGFGGLGANFSFKATNAKGSVILEADSYTGAFDGPGSVPPAKPLPGEKALEPSEISKILIGERMGGPSAGKAKPLPDDLQRKLMDPVDYDPLSLSTGSTLVRIAEAKDVDMVANMPDMGLLLGAYIESQKPTPSMAITLMRQFGFRVTEKDGWLVVTGSQPASTRKDRSDRVALGRFLQATVKKGHLGLEDMASYAASVPVDYNNSLGSALVMLLMPRASAIVYNEPHMLRLYGLMDPVQRREVLSGIRLSSLSPQEAECVNKMVFGESGFLQPSQPISADAMDVEDFYGGIRNEPTELFGRGVPSDSTITLNPTNAQVVSTTQEDDNAGGGSFLVGGQYMDAGSLAQRMYAKERPGIFPWLDNEKPVSQIMFLSGRQSNLNFDFNFGKLAQMNQTLTETQYDSPDPVPYAQLPQDFRDSVEKQLAEMRKNYANVKPGQFGSGFTGQGSAVPPP